MSSPPDPLFDVLVFRIEFWRLVEVIQVLELVYLGNDCRIEVLKSEVFLFHQVLDVFQHPICIVISSLSSFLDTFAFSPVEFQRSGFIESGQPFARPPFLAFSFFLWYPQVRDRLRSSTLQSSLKLLFYAPDLSCRLLEDLKLADFILCHALEALYLGLGYQQDLLFRVGILHILVSFYSLLVPQTLAVWRQGLVFKTRQEVLGIFWKSRLCYCGHGLVVTHQLVLFLLLLGILQFLWTFILLIGILLFQI